MSRNTPFETDELISQLKQRSSEAINFFYEKYAPALYTVILQIVRDEKLAVIVLRDTFREIIEKIEVYSPREKLLIWLFKIARNAAIVKVKPAKNRVNEAEQISRKISNLEIDNFGLKKLILKLKDEQRIILDLCYFKGYTYADIAKTLEISEESVGKKLRMAVLELRVFLM